MQLVLISITLVFTLVINALANILPINGILTADVSDKFMNYFTPAGYVFSIWGLIYIGLIANLIYLIIKRKELKELISSTFIWYILANIGNGIWMLLWHYNILWASVICMLVILIALTAIYLEIFKKNINMFFVKYPISLYLGWITVATVANISVYLTSLNIINDYRIILAGVIYLVVGSLGFIFTTRHKEYVYPLVFIWALVGILVRFSWVSGIVYGTIAGIVIVVGGIIYSVVRGK